MTRPSSLRQLHDFNNHAPAVGSRVVTLTPEIIERSEGVWEMTGTYDDDDPTVMPYAYTCNGTPELGYELWCAGESIEGTRMGCQLAADFVATIAGVLAAGDATLGDTVVFPLLNWNGPVANCTLWVGQPEADLARYGAADAIARGATLVVPILWSCPPHGRDIIDRLNGDRT